MPITHMPTVQSVRCGQGHLHLGHLGATGLALIGEGSILMQKRSSTVDYPLTWGIPGGRIGFMPPALTDTELVPETPVYKSLREGWVEAGIRRRNVGAVLGQIVDDHGRGWQFTTVVRRAIGTPTGIPLRGNVETAELAWTAFDDVPRLRLHPSFARTWPQVLAIARKAAK